jgi:septum formation protein
MIILASRSPQRRSLLAAIGVPFRVVTSDYDEPDLPGLAPDSLVVEHARHKAAEVGARAGIPAGGAVLGCDTAVVIDGDVLGKPADRDAAVRMMRRLSGRRHLVMSGLCLATPSDQFTAVARTEVSFREITPAHLDWYLARGEWQGRAGGYAIQGSGASLVTRIDGDFTNVVGLPIGVLVSLLTDAGLVPW